MTDYEAIKDKVDEALVAMNVKFEVVNAGVRTVEPEKDKNEHSVHWPTPKPYEQDAWRFTLMKVAGPASSKLVHRWSSDFFTGTGNRVMPKGFKLGFHQGYVRPGTIAWAENEAFKKPVKPRAADVLYCILSDGQAQHMSFHDWASDFGMDTDSLKALNTYNTCCEIGRELSKLFSSEEREQLQELVSEL